MCVNCHHPSLTRVTIERKMIIQPRYYVISNTVLRDFIYYDSLKKIMYNWYIARTKQDNCPWACQK